jgi:molecular chaperone GrpE
VSDDRVPAADRGEDLDDLPQGPEDEIVDGELEDMAVDEEVIEGDLVDLELSAESLVADLEAVVAERDQFLDAYRRAQADFENFRKQAQKREHDAIDRAVTALVGRLLPVLDAGDAAQAHGGAEAAAVEQVAGLLYETLAKEGLEAVDPEPGEMFDPNVHDAVAHEPGEGEPAILEVLRTGYIWKGRTLRPAMVRVKG